MTLQKVGVFTYMEGVGYTTLNIWTEGYATSNARLTYMFPKNN